MVSKKKVTIANKYYWYERVLRGNGNFKIFDKDAVSLAYWQINQKTGELFGILADGTGGGGKSVERQLKELNMVMDCYIALFNLVGGMNLPLSIVATYGKTLVKLYAIVCEVIIIMDTTGMNDKIADAIKELACNVAKEIAFASGLGEIMAGLDNMIAMLGDGSGLFKC